MAFRHIRRRGIACFAYTSPAGSLTCFIALMVWLLPGAESSRVGIIIIVTYLIGLGGFHHIIAGSNKNFFLVVTGAESWGYYLIRFFLPTLTGNIIGEVSLVAFLNHAQVVAGKESRRAS